MFSFYFELIEWIAFYFDGGLELYFVSCVWWCHLFRFSFNSLLAAPFEMVMHV